MTAAIIVHSLRVEDPGSYETHQHPVHQLAWAASGTVTMGIGDETWVLPRSRALWIPAGLPHHVMTNRGTTMLSLYFDPEACPATFDMPTVFETSDLLGQLIEHLLGDLGPQARTRAERVLFDLLEPASTTSLKLPDPTDPRGRAVADMLRDDPSDQRTLSDYASEVGASTRTLARIIQRETGMGFADWRTHIRIAAALPQLASGESVSQVSGRVGYATPSAFVAAFRRTTGTTPGRYFDSTAVQVPSGAADRNGDHRERR